ncbi:MAG: WD40 repeat domain-containing serine/threonine protein kinase [Planctomycetota bacterium]
MNFDSAQDALQNPDDSKSGDSIEDWLAAYLLAAPSLGADERARWLAKAPSPIRAELAARIAKLSLFDTWLEDSANDFLEPSAAPEAPAAAAPPPGTMLGDFRLLRRIGGGGMGTVYLAEQVSLGRRVALKMLPPAYATASTSGERFRREAKTIAKLSHPNIVGVHAYGEAEGISYLALDYVEGESLAERIAKRREQGRELNDSEVRAVVTIGHAIAGALAYAHALGIVHRDVKPQNIIIDGDGEPHLVDFGLAKDSALDSLSRSGDWLGTPHYMAPEQAQPHGGTVDERTDVYGLGATLYEALGQTPPFAGATLEQLAHQIAVAEPRPLARLCPAAARELASVVHTALEKDPRHRYQSAAELAADLRRWLEGHTVLARPARMWRRSVRLARRRPLLVVSAVLGLVAAISLPLAWIFHARLEAQQRERDGLRLIGEANATIEQDPTLALRLAIEGAERAPGLLSTSTLYAAWRAAARAGHEYAVLNLHTATIHALRFDRSGTRLAAASADHTASIWSLPHGDLIQQLKGARARVVDVDISLDGREAITASYDGTVRVWSLEDGRETACLAGAPAPVFCARYAADDSLIVAGCADGTVTAFDRVAPHALRWRRTGGASVSVGRYVDAIAELEASLALSPDRRSLAIAAANACLVLCDAATGAELWSTPQLGARVCAIRFARNGAQLCFYSFATTRAQVLAVTNGQLLLEAPLGAHTDLRGVQLSDDGALFSALSPDALRTWQTATGASLATIELVDTIAPRQHFNAYAPTGTKIATAHIGGTTSLWSVESGLGFERVRSKETEICAIDFAPDGSVLATAGPSGNIYLWQRGPGTQPPIEFATGVPGLRTIEYDATGERVLANGIGLSAALLARADGAAIWRLDGEKVASLMATIDTFNQRESLVNFVAALPNSSAFAIVTPACVYRWDSNSRFEQLTKNPHSIDEQILRRVAVSPDGRRYSLTSRRVAGGFDGSCWIHAIDGATPAIELGDHERVVRTAEFDAQSQRVVTASLDGRARVFDVATGALITVFAGHDADVRVARFSPDGQRVISCAWNRCAWIWEAATGAPILQLAGHSQSIEAAEFSPDGRHVVTTSLDGTARLWDAGSGEALAVLALDAPSFDVDFRADGREFAIACEDGRVCFWPFPPEDGAARMAQRSLSTEERARYAIHSATAREIESASTETRPPVSVAPSPQDRRDLSLVAYDVWSALRDGTRAADRLPQALRDLAWLMTNAPAPGSYGVLEALASLRRGENDAAIRAATAVNDLLRDRLGRDDLLALCVLAEAHAASGATAAARDALERAEALALTPPWNWTRDPDPLVLLREARLRVRGL